MIINFSCESKIFYDQFISCNDVCFVQHELFVRNRTIHPISFYLKIRKTSPGYLFIISFYSTGHELHPQAYWGHRVLSLRISSRSQTRAKFAPSLLFYRDRRNFLFSIESQISLDVPINLMKIMEKAVLLDMCHFIRR